MRSRSTRLTFLVSRRFASCCALLLAGAAFGLVGDARILSWRSGSASTVAGRVAGSPRPVAALALANQAPALQPQTRRPLWAPVAEDMLPAPAQLRRLVSSRYRTLRLDQDVLREDLARAPLERAAAAVAPDAVMELPWPDGRFRRFRIEESPIMEPALAAQFPELKTYAGQGVDDPTASVRLDWTPSGFHAMILSAEGTIYVDPYSPGDTQHYIVYDKRDYRRADARPFVEPVLAPAQQSVPTPLVQPLHGDTLRTYRLAVAATAEYTAVHGGTVAGAMNGIVTTVNRVNGIYERDVAVRMILVGNNASIVYTNGATDPYTDNDLTVLPCQNARNLDAVIGDVNYDIGHVFATQTGGGSAPGRACNGANACGGANPGSDKGRGATGDLSPQGDPFDVDFVAHEMGHQFGANHTFNGTTLVCGGARTASTAFEPGSGSTIMGYAGPRSMPLCGAESLQDNSDAYFHAASQDEIIAFITNPLTGGSCGGTVATGNTPPTVNAGPDYTMPARTAFTLTAAGADADGDFLTYAWEEMDRGTASPPHGDDGSRPLFRSFPPTPSPSRTFPRLSDILNRPPETATFGEWYPTTTRLMNFRVTVRDNRLRGGGTASDDMVLNVRADSGPFSVTYPNTAVTWTTGSLETVTWDVANTSLAPVSAANVKISLSTDGGNTFPVVLAASTPNDGSETITVPHFATASARIKIEAVGNVFFDVSNTNFTINASSSALSIDDVTVTEDNFGTATMIFTVTLSPLSASTVTVAYATADGTATAPSDYASTSGTLTFAPGSSTATIAVTVNGDVTNEVDETVLVNLSSPANATIADSQGLATITNDDASVSTPGIVDGTFEAGNPWPAWTVQTATIRGTPICHTSSCGIGVGPFEGAHWAMFTGASGPETATLGQTVTLPLASSLTLRFQMQVGTVPSSSFPEDLVISVDGNPYWIFTSPASPESAYSPRQVDLTPFADGAAHTLLFSHEAPRFDQWATFHIDNVELVSLAPTLSIDDGAVTEGNSGTTADRFTVTLSPPRAATVTVNYATADGTAAAGSDYTAASGLLTFLPGETTKTIDVVVNGDATFEPNESFLINLSNAANATISRGQGVGTIINDEGVGPASAISDGTFEAGSPYPAWTVQTSTNFGTPLCDTVLCGNGGGTAGPFGGTNWAWFGGANAPESSSIGQTVTLPLANSLTLQFQMWVGFVTAPATDTLVVSVDGIPVRTFPEPASAEVGYSLRQVDLTRFADGAAHELLFSYEGPSAGVANFSVDSIELFSSPPTLPSISMDDVAVPEGNSGTTTASFTVTLSTTSAQPVTVAYATTNGTATAGSDYLAASGTVTFVPGTTTQRIDVTVNGDTVNETSETFVVNLSSPTNATLSDSQGVGTINNDDPIPALTISDVTLSEGNAGTTNAIFTVTLSAASGQQVTVAYRTDDGTATAGSDYAAASGTLTFAPGVTTQSITVAVNGDTADEPDEVFFVNLGSPVNATITGRPGVGTIANDEATLSINDVTVLEGNAGAVSATFTVTLSAASSQQVTVAYATADGTATTAGNDYTPTSGMLTFAPGVTVQTITVAMNGDTINEPDETFLVNLANSVHAVITDGQGVGTIVNDDQP